jgi:hypothetical protein
VPARDPISTGVQDPPKLPVKVRAWNVVPQILRPLGRLTVRQAVEGLGRDALRSECLAVMAGIPGVTFPAPQGG